MKYLGKITDQKDLTTKEYVDNSINAKVSINTDIPSMDGTGAAGTSDRLARVDHVHPTDTSRANKNLIADDFSTSHPYEVGEYCIYNQILYKCTTAHSGAWDAAHFEEKNLGEELKFLEDTDNEKANIDGSYSSMTVGNAEQLVSTVGIEDSVPYNFRTAGGSSDIGDRETDMVVGGTVAWNQLAPGMEASNWQAGNSFGSVSFSDGIGVLTSTSRGGRIQPKSVYNDYTTKRIGHVILGIAKVKLTTATTDVCLEVVDKRINTVSTSEWQTLKVIKKITSEDTHNYIAVVDLRYSDFDDIQVKDVNSFDLTQMFGSAIADYIYGLEQANAGAGVAWFRKLFPKPYYAYNAGELMSVNTSAHKMIGFNAWDEQWEGGGINQNTGANTSNANAIRAKNFIPVIPGSTYYIKAPIAVRGYWYDYNKNYIKTTSLGVNATFEVPDDAHYLRFIIGNSTTPVTSYNNDICINLHWDGERDGEYEPYEEHTYALDSDLELRGIPTLDANNNLYYDGDTYESDGAVTRKFGVRAYQEGDATDGSTMITDGTNTVYKLTSTTTETADPYQNPQIVNDFGTEEYVDAGVTASTPTRDVAIPVGHQTFYQNNLRAKLEMAPNSPSGDGDYIVRQTDGENTYVPLVIPTELPTNPSENGTYSLKVTVADGVATLSWVVDV